MSSARLGHRFFERYTPDVARDLLGRALVRMIGGERLSGEIVEVEAYRGDRDPASHAYAGRTPRNAVMFGEPGHAYVYLAYGFHHCLNLTTERSGAPGAVLVRAIEPVEGIREMMRNRRTRTLESLTNGPGKLTQALRIDRTLNGEDLATSPRLFVETGSPVRVVGITHRVGIRSGTRFNWRFSVEGNRFVSKGKPS